MKIQLNENDYISNYINEIPSDNGLHLVVGGTGTGKTKYLCKQCEYAGIAVFPVKALIEQEKNNADKDGRILKFKQLEKFVEMDTDFITQNFEAVYIDEVQLIYQSGFRTETVNRLYSLINGLRKYIPVYCLSGTFLDEFSPLDFDTETVFEKDTLKRHVNIKLPVDYSKGKTSITQSDVLHHVREALKHRIPVMVYHNNEQDNIYFTEEMKKDGVKAMSVSSAHKSDRYAFEQLLRTNKIASTGMDVIFTTTVLSEGIDIHDRTHIIHTQDTPEKIIQGFGRVRDYTMGSYTLIIGAGEAVLNNEYIETTADALFKLDGIAQHNELKFWSTNFRLDAIDNQRHQRQILKYNIRNTLLRRCTFGLYVAGVLHNYYNLSCIIDNTEKFKLVKLNPMKRTDKVAIIKGVELFGEDKTKIATYVHEKNKELNHRLPEIWIENAFGFRDNYNEVAASNVNHNWLCSGTLNLVT